MSKGCGYVVGRVTKSLTCNLRLLAFLLVSLYACSLPKILLRAWNTGLFRNKHELVKTSVLLVLFLFLYLVWTWIMDMVFNWVEGIILELYCVDVNWRGFLFVFICEPNNDGSWIELFYFYFLFFGSPYKSMVSNHLSRGLRPWSVLHPLVAGLPQVLCV